MEFIAIIPARYASTRFPAKPLAMLGGKTVIERVYRRAENHFSQVVVATDDQRIADAVTSFGGRAVMTSIEHRSGTDRCWEAFTHLMRSSGLNPDSDDVDRYVVVNIQGDEPFIHPQQLETIKSCFSTPQVNIATLAKPFTMSDGWKALENPNSPKVIFDQNHRAIYFSRSVIPYLRGTEKGDEWLEHHTYYKHIGIYAYRGRSLREITRLPQTTLEKAESLEQLRWIENNYHIEVGITEIETIGIDTPEDLSRAEQFLLQHPQSDF